jgi:alanyl-tRNA synthetase
MGGQVGDTGELSVGGRLWRIVDTQKAGGAWLHFVEGDEAPAAGEAAELRIDLPRRAAIQRHHSVTHLLHWALHEVVSRDATQKGSYVGPEKLTFDFSSAALTAAQLVDVERLVNERIMENAGISWTEVAHADVKKRSDVMQFFGDKYGDTVRVVQIGGQAGALDGYSMELCGGTHARATGEIGAFRIVAESSVAAGIRRIEAVCGMPALDWTRREHESLRGLAARLSVPPEEVTRRVEALQEQLKKMEKERKEAAKADALRRVDGLLALQREVNGRKVLVADVGELEVDSLRLLADGLRARMPSGVILLGAGNAGKVSFIASASDDAVAGGVHCGKLIGAVAKIAGGGGGGKPNKAEAGGKDPARLGDALAEALNLLSA